MRNTCKKLFGKNGMLGHVGIVLIIISSYGQGAASSRDARPFDFICGTPQETLLSYSQLYETDRATTNDRLWLDENDGKLVGLRYQGTKEKWFHIEGVMGAGKSVILCEYLGKKLTAVYIGKMNQQGNLRVTHHNKPGKATWTEWFRQLGNSGSRSYGIKYVGDEQVHHLNKSRLADDEPHCSHAASYFKAVGWKNKSSQSKLNKIIEDQLNHFEKQDELTARCLTAETYPQKSALSIVNMYASDRYLSAKIAYFKQDGKVPDLFNKGVNLNLNSFNPLQLNDLLQKQYKPLILKIVRSHLKSRFGTAGRFTSMKNIEFSFNTHTLVISFPPVDQYGFYINKSIIEVPIPLKDLSTVIRPDGPLGL